ncbi:unnamed protein product [Dicrocoelium dendriticum]|nr:unnamed protein product [Dicrocoelium dendriticum]
MQVYRNYIVKIFDSWTVIRLSREQCSGGTLTNQKINLLIDRIADVVRKLKDEDEVALFIEDYFDDELNIICEDDSIPYVAKLLVDGMALLQTNKVAELQRKIECLPNGCDLALCQEVCPVSSCETDEDDCSDSSSDVEME